MKTKSRRKGQAGGGVRRVRVCVCVWWGCPCPLIGCCLSVTIKSRAARGSASLTTRETSGSIGASLPELSFTHADTFLLNYRAAALKQTEHARLTLLAFCFFASEEWLCDRPEEGNDCRRFHSYVNGEESPGCPEALWRILEGGY